MAPIPAPVGLANGPRLAAAARRERDVARVRRRLRGRPGAGPADRGSTTDPHRGERPRPESRAVRGSGGAPPARSSTSRSWTRGRNALVGSLWLHSYSARHRPGRGRLLGSRRRRGGRGVDPGARSRSCSTGLFADCGLERVEITTDHGTTMPSSASPGSSASPAKGSSARRNLERGRRVDLVLFGLLRGEWAPRRGLTPSGSDPGPRV